MLNFLNNISPVEIVIIVLILVIFFGSKILTHAARTGGKTFKEIKNIKKEFTEALKDDDTKEESK